MIDTEKKEKKEKKKKQLDVKGDKGNIVDVRV